MNGRVHEDYITHDKWSICVIVVLLFLRGRSHPCSHAPPPWQRSWVMGSCDLGLSESASHRVRLGNSSIVILSQRTDSQGGTKGPGNQAREKNTLLGLFSVC